MEILLVSSTFVEERENFAQIVREAQSLGVSIKYSLVPKVIRFEDKVYRFTNVAKLLDNRGDIRGREFSEVLLSEDARNVMPIGLLEEINSRVR